MDGTSISYATSKDWLDIMKNRSKVRMHELIERLGLRAKWSSNKRGKTNFESALVRELVADMGEVVATLPKDADELMKFRSKEGSLKSEVDGLIEKHGSKVWGRAGDREHLLTANEAGVDDGLYDKDLFYEQEEDKQLIHKLLHWWIGLKACNVILARERLDRERRKKAENRQARADAEHANQQGEAPASFVALAPNSVLHDVDTGSRGSPMSSSAMMTPPESGNSPISGPREAVGFNAVNTHTLQGAPQHQNIVDGVWSRFAANDSQATAQASNIAEDRAAAERQAAQLESAASNRNTAVSVAQLVASFRGTGPENVPQTDKSVPYRGLDYDTLRELRAHIYDEEYNPTIELKKLLDHIERIWRELVRADLEKMLQDPGIFFARERALQTWIELKRHIAAIERAEKRWATQGSSDDELDRRRREYATLMGANQAILTSFEDIGIGLATGDVVDRDELLRQAIVTLAGEKYAVEMQWKNIEFTSTIRSLAEVLEMFRKEEEEDAQGTLYYVG